jgi:hypothetical protein
MSARAEPAFQPNYERIARTSQESAAGRSTSPCCTGTGSEAFEGAGVAA